MYSIGAMSFQSNSNRGSIDIPCAPETFTVPSVSLRQQPVRKTRLSIAPSSSQENANPQLVAPTNSSYLSNGFKIIEGVFKSTGVVVSNSSDDSTKNSLAMRAKPLTTADGKAQTLRASNRRKSIAIGAKVEVWKDL